MASSVLDNSGFFVPMRPDSEMSFANTAGQGVVHPSVAKATSESHGLSALNDTTYLKLPHRLNHHQDTLSLKGESENDEANAILFGLQAMQHRIDGLERERENMADLRTATDTYTALLRNRNTSYQTGHHRSSVEMARNGSSHTEPSSVPAARSSSPLMSAIRPPALSLNESTRSASMRPLPPDTASSVGSSVLRLTDKQRTNLNQYSDLLRRELQSMNKSIEPKLASNRSGNNTRIEQTNSTPKKPQLPSVQDRAVETVPTRENGQVADADSFDYVALRERLAKLKERYLEVRQETPAANPNQRIQPVATHHGMEKRTLSAPTSPQLVKARRSESSRKKNDKVMWKPPPFVAGKATGASHSLTVNLQQLLAVLKNQNPVLHQICLRLGPDAPISQLAEAFRKQLISSIGEWETQLDRDIKLYDRLCSADRTAPDFERIEEERDNVAVRIERKDTIIQRAQGQLIKLDQLLSERTRSCHRGGRTKLGASHILDHTVSSSTKWRAPSPNTKSKPSGAAGKCLREIRSLKSVLTPDNVL